MTIMNIESGACGFNSVVRADRNESKQVRISIISDCPQVSALAQDIVEMGIRDIFTAMDQNVVVKKAGEHRLHPVCPVPCGILKAAEAELGLAVKRDIKLLFTDEAASDD